MTEHSRGQGGWREVRSDSIALNPFRGVNVISCESIYVSGVSSKPKAVGEALREQRYRSRQTSD